MFQQVTGEGEREKTPFGAEMETIDSVAPRARDTFDPVTCFEL